MSLALISILLFAGYANAQDTPAEQNDQGKATIRLDHRIEFSEAVEHALLDKDNSGNMIPRILVKGKEIEIMDGSGNKVKTIPREDEASKHIETHFYPGEGGKVMAVHVTRGQNKKSESWNEGEYLILDKNGGRVPKAVEIVVAFGWCADSSRFVSPFSSHATDKALSELFSTTGTPVPIVS